MIGKEPELAGRAAPFAVEPRLGQAGFLAADLGNRLRPGLDLVGDGAQEGGALLARGIAIGPEGFLSRLAGPVHQLYGAYGKIMRRAMRRRRSEGACPIEPFARDEVFSFGGENHLTFLSLDHDDPGRFGTRS